MIFHEYKLAVVVDEYDQCNRDTEYKIQREEKLKETLGCVFIRINPDEKDFNIIGL